MQAFHVGHMRNVAIGDSLVRLYEQLGHDGAPAITSVSFRMGRVDESRECARIQYPTNRAMSVLFPANRVDQSHDCACFESSAHESCDYAGR